ncbi:transglycosylase SLT domain-containing protein [Azoarcus sp. L1K30]|uniref:transglycosylase SLT domain-containing protein n=1 Tax=Azoarcus sp. L1K30 TaxID=2820277 RepID=UPI001B81D777|nr:transglycosylase SLT domain-containing protein [Azoarcus sp. L1K30]MBR0565804.1 transglycosylase SLT domain-containing protein [Azoarcus sp. L1K30]
MAKLVSLFLGVLLLLPVALSRPAMGAEEEPRPASVAVEAAEVAPPRVLTLDLTRNANDIWDRIRRGFGMPDLDSPLVSEQQIFYLNRPGFLKQVFARGGRYLYYIVDELERRGMPTELALLPMVESSYNPLAYSRSHASGLWQFIPSTGRNFNLTQDNWVDERRDVVASTNAALDYLQSIYEMHGDWHLALASYNWGEGAVGRAMQRNRDAGLPVEYSELRMPNETRNYVPKLQAIKNIVAEPELFHIELPYVANEQHFVTLNAPQGIDLGTAASLADMSLEEFLALNPGFNRPAITTPGQTLVVPADRAARFASRLSEFELSGKGWRTHELAPGEKPGAVADRHGLTLAQLLQLNGLSSGSRINPGYTLLVPDGIDPSGALAASRLLPANARLASAPTIKLSTGNIASTPDRSSTRKTAAARASKSKDKSGSGPARKKSTKSGTSAAVTRQTKSGSASANPPKPSIAKPVTTTPSKAKSPASSNGKPKPTESPKKR